MAGQRQQASQDHGGPRLRRWLARLVLRVLHRGAQGCDQAVALPLELVHLPAAGAERRSAAV